MLFSHSGAEVRAAFLDSAGEWLTEAPLKLVCGHSVLTATHQPGWFFAGQPFDATLVVSPSAQTQQQLISGLAGDAVTEFIVRHSQIIRILQTKQLMPIEADFAGRSISFMELPAQPLRLSEVFQKTLASVTAQLAARARLGKTVCTIRHEVPQPLQAVVPANPLWLQRLTGALNENGLNTGDSSRSPDLVINAYDGPAVNGDGVLDFSAPASGDTDQARLTVTFVAEQAADSSITADQNHIFIKRQHNGLKLFDIHGPRLLPDVSGQCCYARLAAYLVTTLSREISADEAQP